jgi:hypothetical protein
MASSSGIILINSMTSSYFHKYFYFLPEPFPDKILITRDPSYIPPYFSIAVPVGFLPDDINL